MSGCSCHIAVERGYFFPYGMPWRTPETFDRAEEDGSEPREVVPDRYLFGGKEYLSDDGRDEYYFLARNYIPSLPHFDRHDPKAEKYYSVSPYLPFAGNPVNVTDPTGKEIIPKLFREAAFCLRHPKIALDIGEFKHGSINISTVSTRFSTRGEILYGSKRNEPDEGSENGAFRHALWQAKITADFGEKIAIEAGNAHEDNPDADLSKKTFDNIKDSDEAVDLLNNIIGREIGNDSDTKDFQKLAMKVLEVFNNDGLYTAKKDKNGNFIIKKTKLSKEKFENLKKAFNSLNNNGFNNCEQEKYDMELQEYRTYQQIVYPK